MVVSAALAAGLLGWGARRLAAREAAVAAVAAAADDHAAGDPGDLVCGRGGGHGADPRLCLHPGGDGVLLRARADQAAAGPAGQRRHLGGGGRPRLYNAGVAYVGRANEKVEPGYATPPASDLVSGSDASLLPFADLGQQGRRYVTDVVTPELIEEVMGEPAVAHPIRTYVGFNSEPLYPTGRAELALAELDRTGAFDRSYLLLVSPTGTGWVDHTLIQTAEFLTRGDIATCCVQYGRYPSSLSVQKVALGRSQFRLLLWGVNQRLAERPPDRRPRVLVFGESLGAWTSSDVVMFQGIEGFDHYGIDRALWVGLPWLAKWSRMGMTRGASAMVPEGTVGVFDRHEQLAELTDTQRARLRATILSHDNDPIAVMGPELIVRRPAWLADSQRGRGVPTQGIALAAADHLRPDGHGRRQRDGVGAGRLRLLRPRLPGRHGALRARRLRPARRQRRPGGAHRGGPAVPGAGTPPNGSRPSTAMPPRRHPPTGPSTTTPWRVCRSAIAVPPGLAGSEDDSRVQHPRPPVEGEPAAWSTPERC